MKKYFGIIFAIWLAVTGLGVLAMGIGWNQTVADYFAALPNVSAWTQLAPFVYIVWVLVSGLALIVAAGFIGAWAGSSPKVRSMADANWREGEPG